jgi:hypothetical protein
LGGEARFHRVRSTQGKLAIHISRHEEDIQVGRVDEGATTAERTERLLRMLWEEPAKMVSN